MPKCNHPGCLENRWRGQNGKQHLAYCQEHQRAYWRQQKSNRRNGNSISASKENPTRPGHAERRGRKAVNRKPQRPEPVQQSTISPQIASLAQLPSLEKCVLVDEKSGTVTVIWQRKLENIKHIDEVLELYKADDFEILIEM